MDIHTQTAAEVFGISEDLVTTEQRILAREINFGILYGNEGGQMADLRPAGDPITPKENQMKVLQSLAQTSMYRAMYGGGYGLSNMAPLRAQYDAYYGIASRVLARDGWGHYAPVKIKSPVTAAALSGFDVQAKAPHT